MRAQHLTNIAVQIMAPTCVHVGTCKEATIEHEDPLDLVDARGMVKPLPVMRVSLRLDASNPLCQAMQEIDVLPVRV